MWLNFSFFHLDQVLFFCPQLTFKLSKNKCYFNSDHKLFSFLSKTTHLHHFHSLRSECTLKVKFENTKIDSRSTRSENLLTKCHLLESGQIWLICQAKYNQPFVSKLDNFLMRTYGQSSWSCWRCGWGRCCGCCAAVFFLSFSLSRFPITIPRKSSRPINEIDKPF